MNPKAIFALVCMGAAAAFAGEPATSSKTDSGNEFFLYVQWVLDTPLTESQRAEARPMVEAAIADPKADDAAIVSEAIVAYKDLQNHSESDRRTLRPSVEDEYLKSLKLRHRKSKLAAWIHSVKESSSKALVPGRPPLTRQSVDALAELLQFIAQEAGAGALQADDAAREAFVKAITASYKALNDEQKTSLAELPKDWASLRSGWPTFPEEKKAKLREEWKKNLPKTAVKLENPELQSTARGLLPKVSTWL